MKLAIISSYIILQFFVFTKAEVCEVPRKIADFEWNVNGMEDNALYFPFGQRNDTNLIKILLYGSSLNPDEDLPKLCPRLRFNDTTTILTGVNGTSALYKCESSDGKKWVRDCTYQVEGKSEYNYKMYVTLTDKKSYAFVIRCWENGLRGWTVISTKKFLHDDVQFLILEHAKAQGFETAETLPLRYKNCS